MANNAKRDKGQTVTAAEVAAAVLAEVGGATPATPATAAGAAKLTPAEQAKRAAWAAMGITVITPGEVARVSLGAVGYIEMLSTLADADGPATKLADIRIVFDTPIPVIGGLLAGQGAAWLRLPKGGGRRLACTLPQRSYSTRFGNRYEDIFEDARKPEAVEAANTALGLGGAVRSSATDDERNPIRTDACRVLRHAFIALHGGEDEAMRVLAAAEVKVRRAQAAKDAAKRGDAGGGGSALGV